jgi:hypothetical protein
MYKYRNSSLGFLRICKACCLGKFAKSHPYDFRVFFRYVTRMIICMKKKFLVFCTLSCLVFSPGCDTLQQLGGGTLTAEEIARGLKEALEIGISEGSTTLSQVNGYYKSPYKILLPAEARKVTDKLRIIPGFSQAEEVILERIRHSPR